METNLDLRRANSPLHVLLVGNNPIDLTRTLEKINQVHGQKIITEIAFDLRSLLERLVNFRPHYILMDDNIGKEEMTEAVKTLRSDKKTREVPITVLKNSNYAESSADGVLDYVLKQSFSAESFYNMLRNSLKVKRAQMYLSKAYRDRKRRQRNASV